MKILMRQMALVMSISSLIWLLFSFFFCFMCLSYFVSGVPYLFYSESDYLFFLFLSYLKMSEVTELYFFFLHFVLSAFFFFLKREIEGLSFHEIICCLNSYKNRQIAVIQLCLSLFVRFIKF